MRERGLEWKVGLMLVIAAAVLVGFVFVLGNWSLSSGYTIYVDYDYSGNLQPGAPVKVAGMKVGKVEDVSFLGGKLDPETNRRVYVRVAVWVEDRAKDSIRQDAEFFVNTAGVLGEQYVEIVPGRDWEHPPVAPGSKRLGRNPPRTDLVLSRLYDVLDSLSQVLTEDKDVIKNLLRNSASAVASADELLRDNKAQLGKLIASSTGLADQATQTLTKLNASVDGRALARTVNDADALLVSGRQAIDKVTPEAVALMTDARRVTGIVTEDRVDRAIGVADKAADAVGKAGGLIDNVDGMVTDLRKGKGTAGALLVKDDVYLDVRELLRDLKRNPWKFFWKE
ncbi:MAG: MCE family protein [Myxococcales bacterium]|nr:MCE family protein [Myxococcales bacterium]MBK7196789.1 MCE family protein [Myxococcales bacterium]MBP6844083.1 MCE family protein [Kofleriaceae bacterium]